MPRCKSKKNTLVKSRKRINGGKKPRKQRKQTKKIRRYAPVQYGPQPQYGPQQIQIENKGPAFGNLRDAPANALNAAALGFGADFGVNLGEKAINGIFGDE